jgi:hypothetical protein
MKIVAKSKEVKTGSNLAESYKEGCGSKRAVLPMMMIDILHILVYSLQFCFTNYFYLLQIQIDISTHDGNDKCLQNFNQKPEAEQFGPIGNVSDCIREEPGWNFGWAFDYPD